MTPGLVVVLNHVRMRIVDFPPDDDYVRVRTASGKLVTIEKKLLSAALIPEDPDQLPLEKMFIRRKRKTAPSVGESGEPAPQYRKNCKHCGKEFMAAYPNKEICYKYCKDKRTQQEERTVECKHCGKEYSTKYPQSLFCNSKCRRNNYWRRLSEQKKQAKLEYDRQRSAERNTRRKQLKNEKLRAEIEKSIGFLLSRKENDLER